MLDKVEETNKLLEVELLEDRVDKPNVLENASDAEVAKVDEDGESDELAKAGMVKGEEG